MRKILLGLVGLLIAVSAAAKADPLDDKRAMGKADAPITVIEYASMTCGHCAHLSNDILPQIKTAYIDTGKVRWIFRDFPLDQIAVRGSMLARCAPPEQFFAYIDTMFRTQANWAFGSDPIAGLARIAKLGGMGQEKFDACMADKQIEDAVLKQRLDGANEFKINATPTLIMNGKKIENGRNFDDYDTLFKQALK